MFNFINLDKIMYLIIILYALTMFIVIYSIFKKDQETKERVIDIFKGNAITPDEFLKLRNASPGGRGSRKYINHYNVPGVYVAINYSRNLFYIGQGQRVFDRIYHLFSGKGNMEVYNDYRSGDNIQILTFYYDRNEFNTLPELRLYLTQRFKEQLTIYGQENKTILRKEKKISNQTQQKGATSSNLGRPVTRVVEDVDQPWGGYLRIAGFTKYKYEDNKVLSEHENISATTVGSAIDYLTRLSLGVSPFEAFYISLKGADIVEKQNQADALIDSINGLSDESITAACQLTGFDVAYRRSRHSFKDEYITIKPDTNTINNIRIMVERTLIFLKANGPIVKNGFDLEGAYTDFINKGDGDFLTKEILLDLKVSKNNPNKNHTLQLLIYYLMGLRSIHQEFHDIKYLGIYNPRLNTSFMYPISDIPRDVIKKVETEIIGY